MDIEATKLELIQELISTNKESLLAKVKTLLATEKEEVVGSIGSKPLTEKALNASLERSEEDIQSGYVISDEDLAKEIETW